MKSYAGSQSRGAAKAAAMLLACAFLVPAFQSQTPVPKTAKSAASGDQQAQQKPKASIEGVVIDAVLGTPVKDANLLLASDSGTGTPSSTKTDEKGHFLFQNLDEGRYVLVGDHPRYARQSYGSRNGLLGGTFLSVVPGQSISDITFKLQQNAVASGKVVDADGDPVAGVMVAALKGMYLHGKRQFMPVGTAMTNDVGEYRLANLATGRYMISASLMNLGAANKPAGSEPEQSFVTTYFPNATDATGAGPVMVPPGGEIGGMDIRMVRLKSVRVKGRVIGAPADQEVTVRLVPKDAGVMGLITGRNATVKKQDGTFEIAGATAGSYTLRAGDATGLKAMGSVLPLEVGDKPIEGVALEIAAAIDQAGTLAVEDSDLKPVAGIPLKGTRVLLESASGMILIPPNVPVAEDGTFMFKELPAEKYFVRVMNGPPNCYVSSVRLGPQEMGDDGLNLGLAGTGRIEIKLRQGGALVDGVIRGEDGGPMAGVTVALVPASRKYLLYQSTFTDQKGAFRFRNVTPGDYKVLAWEEVEPNAFQDPEFLKPFEGRAEAISLKDNEHKSITTLKTIPRGQ